MSAGTAWSDAVRLEKLQRVVDAALAHLSLDDLLDEILIRVRDILAADTCAVLLLDETGKELVARAAKGLEEEVERGTRIPMGKGFAGRVAATRQLVAIEDVDHADIINPILREKGIKSLLGAPLLTRGQVLGVIHVGSLTHRIFTPDEQELLELAAERVALAVQKALVHDELMRLDRVRHEFVAIASHELRTPASAIYGAARTLDALGDRLDADQAEELQRLIVEQSDRLVALIEQLLDVSRVETAAFTTKPVHLVLHDHLTRLIRETVGNEAEIGLDCPRSLELRADPVAVDRVVGNLIANALRHGAPPVRVTARADGPTVRISVEDRGEGIPDELGGRLFDEFVRGRGTDSKPGSGLGLSIARSYARAQGGDVLYEAVEPHGARFEFVLPTTPETLPGRILGVPGFPGSNGRHPGPREAPPGRAD